MSDRRRHPSPDLAQRLLTEIVCRREEADGHPQDDPQAEAAARATGGDLLARAQVRAAALADSATTLTQLRHLLRWMRISLFVALLLAALAGFAAARLVLGAATLNLPLALAVLVGANLLMLALWLLFTVLGGGARRSARLPWTALASRLRVIGSGDADDPLRDALRILAGGGRAGLLAGSLSHLLWLAYTLAGLVTLALSMTLREYQFGWQTTLLATESLQRLAEVLSWLPAMVGIAGAEQLPMQPPMDDGARQAWAIWLLAAVTAYGIAPRLIAALCCLGLLRHRLRRIGVDAHRPGIARLRDRLIPDRKAQAVSDPAPACAQGASIPVPAAALPPTGVVAVSLEWPHGASVGEAGWYWLPAVDDPGLLADQAARLPPQTRALVVVLRAAATPDRGLERAIVALVATASVPVWLALGDVERLQARGAAVAAQRLADWHALSTRAGTCGVLEVPSFPAGVIA